MGTRAVTNVVNEECDVYVSLYRQYDGYPAGGHGEELAGWLDGAVIGNGISSNVPPNFFNGIGDLALRLVTYFKGNHRDIGSFYLIPPGTDWSPDYTYTVVVPESKGWDAPEGEVVVRVKSFSKELFEGSIEEFQAFVKEEEEDEDDY